MQQPLGIPAQNLGTWIFVASIISILLPHCCKVISFGCAAAIRCGNACDGPCGNCVHPGSEHKEFDSPRLVKHEAGFPNPQRTLIGSNKLWRVIGTDHDTVCARWMVLLSSTAPVVPAVARQLTAAPAGTSAVPDSSTKHDSTERISDQFLFYHNHHFIKSKENLRFRHIVPLFVPIGVCVTTYDDGTASDVTVGLWRHNQQATNHEHNGKPWLFTPIVA